MADRILVPLDGSPRAEQILVQVSRYLRREDAEVVLFRAVDIPYSLVRADTAALLAEERTAATAYLAEVARTLRGQGVDVRVLLREGPAADAILHAAEDEKATLIALSTHGRSGAARWLLGSVAEKVVRGASAPVLLMRSFRSGPQGVPLPAGAHEIPFRKLLVPVDGSETSLRVVPAAAATASLFGAKADVLCVDIPLPTVVHGSIPPMPAPRTTPGGEAAGAAAAAAARFAERGVEARAMTAAGDPASKILETADAEKADLIAMATHGWTGVTRWVLGSVTEKVLRHATLPMLIVPPPPR